MPNDNSQATPAEPVSPQSVTPPGSAAPEVSPQTEQQQEKPLTLEDFRRIAREEATRIAQSQVAKGETRIQKLIQDKFAALDQTKGPLQLTDQQVAEAKQKIIADAYSSAEEPTPTSQPATPQPPAPAEGDDPVYSLTMEAYQTEGIDIKQTDPEFKQLEDALKDPNGSLYKYQKVLMQAIRTKRERTQASTETAAARVLGGGSQPSGQAPAKTAHEAWEQAYNK